MKTSPFKVMTTAALATAIAVPASVATADAAEVELQQIAFELDGEVQVVDFEDYIDAIVSESGDLYDYVTEASPEAIGIGEGEFVSYEALVNAIIDADADMSGQEVLAEVSTDAEALVDEDTVAEYGQWGEDEVEELVLDSVDSGSLKQVELTFNNDVSANEDAADADNYDFGDVASVDSVNVDGNKVVLNLASNVENQTEATLTVDSSVTGEEVTSDVEFFDTTIPEVKGAEVVGQDTIKVKFSEPLDLTDEDGNVKSGVKSAFEVNDGEYFISSVTPLKNNTEVNVKLYSTLEEGTVDVAIDNSLEDYASFNVLSTDLELDVVEDNEAPKVVDYKDATPNGVTLVFNEDIELTDDATFESFYHTNSNNPIVDPSEDDEALETIVSGNELTLNFGENNLPEGTAYVYVDGDSVVDLWGNVNENQLRTEVSVEIDEVKPTLDDISVDSEESITLTFSEDVSDVEDSDFTLLDADGEEADLIKDVTPNGNEVTIDFDEKLSGNHAIVVEDIEDAAGNNIDKVTEAFNVDDLTAPVITEDFSSTLYGGGEEVQTLVIDFGETMATEGKYAVTDLEKYVLVDGEDTYELADIKGVKSSLVEKGSKLEVKIPYDSDDADTLELAADADYDLQIARVADASGNATASLSGTIDVSDEDSVLLSKAEAVDTETVEVTFDDKLVDFESSDLSITADGNEVDVAGRSISEDANGNTVVTFKLDKALNTNAEYGAAVENDDEASIAGSLTVTVNADPESSNKYGEDLKVGDSVSVEDHINPVLDTDTTVDDDGMVESTTASGNTEVTLSFTEDLQGTPASFGTGFSIDGYSFNPTGLGEDEFTVTSVTYDEVTLQVYGDVEDDFDIDYTANQYLTDDSAARNAAQDFSVTVDVYDEE